MSRRVLTQQQTPQQNSSGNPTWAMYRWTNKLISRTRPKVVNHPSLGWAYLSFNPASEGDTMEPGTSKMSLGVPRFIFYRNPERTGFLKMGHPVPSVLCPSFF